MQPRRLPAADCLEWATDDQVDVACKTIVCKTRPSRHGHVYLSIVCQDYKTVYFIYELFKKMQILKDKLQNL